MTEFNLPLLRKAVEWAESEARKPVVDSEWNQESYCIDGIMIGRRCDTAYCIAGHIAEQDGYYGDEEPWYWTDGAADVAMGLLGITFDEAWDDDEGLGLFVSANDIDDVRRIAENIARNHGEEL